MKENTKETFIPADIHTHSTLSHDGKDAPELLAARAFELGIKHFALTDHIENEKMDSWDFWGALERSYGVYRSLKEQYEGRMEVYYGAELGQALYDLPQAERILKEHDFDFVLGSCHRTESYARIDRLPDTDEDRYRCLDEYFEEQLALAEWGGFCALSHLDFPLRFISGDVGGHDIDMSRYDSIISRILDVIIKNDIALEVNSSGIRKGLHVTMPSPRYVQLYHDKGGRMITVGSDAHRACEVGADIPQALSMLRGIGYSEICVFRRKQPIFIQI